MAEEIISCIKQKMLQESLSAYSLERRAGLKSNAVHNILSGRSKNPSISIVQAVAKALNCTVSELIGEEQIYSDNLISANTKTPVIPSKLFQNHKLYTKSLSHFSALLNKETLWLSRETVMNYVDEIYLYSLKKGGDKVDAHFAAWLLEKAKGEADSM